MSAHPVSTMPGREMSHLVPLVLREGKVNEACLAQQAPRERREHGAMTVFESPQMPHFSVQKAQKERRGSQEPWDPQDSQAQQARRARKARRATEALRDCRESRVEMAGLGRFVLLGPKDRKETLALLAPRGWQENLGPLAFLGPPGLDCPGFREIQVAHQALRETRAAPEHQERTVLVGNLGSQGCQGRKERRVTPVKYAQRCLKGSRTLWGSLESQGLKGNQVIPHQPRRVQEL